MRKFLFLCLLLAAGITNLYAMQGSGKPDSVTAAAGSQYDAGFLHQWFYGPLWRDVWITPVKVEVLDINSFDGGLTPVRLGGGMQTKSLRLLSANGREWKFRSVNKDPAKGLPEDVQNSIVTDFAQDQISTSMPYGALAVGPMLEAVDMLQPVPYLYIMPDDPALGEYREEFAGMMGMIEVHPDEGDNKREPDFAGAEKVMGSFKLFHRLEEGHRGENVDPAEYLKARLMDIYLGDWDRHSDQWRWARFEEENGDEWWLPVPRDRDRVFSKFDGFVPSITTMIIPQWKHFDYDYPIVLDITWSGRFVDRRFLSELTKAKWDSVTAFVQSQMTDQVIEEGLRRLPPEIYPMVHEELRGKLVSRREKLPQISEDFYNLINEVVEVYGTDKEEYLEVLRLNEELTEVTLWRKDKDTDLPKEEPIYHKVFDNAVTKEFRIFLLDDDDKAIVKGEADDGPNVRIIGGDGADVLIDSSKVNGYLLHFLPIPEAENKVEFYDSGKKTELTPGPGTTWIKKEYPEAETDLEYFEPTKRQRGQDIVINPIVEFSSDKGLEIGGGPIFIAYDFRTFPYQSWQTLTASYATKLNSFNVEYQGFYNGLIRNSTLSLNVFRSELQIAHYYGFGNETTYSDDLDDIDYYRLRQNLFGVHFGYQYHLSDNARLSFGGMYDFSDMSIDNQVLLTNFHDPGYGLGRMHFAGANTSFEYDSRDVIKNPQSGVYAFLKASWYPEMLDNKETFYRGEFDLRAYYTIKFPNDLTFAFRAGGEKVWGGHPFFKSAFLGGKYNLRGYRSERFAGDAAVFGQAEVRANVSEIKFLIIGLFGLHGFAEVGRVFVNGEDSERWHPSFGGGAYISFLERAVNASFTIGLSEEYISYYFRTKLSF